MRHAWSSARRLSIGLALSCALLGGALGQDAITKDLERAADVVVRVEATVGERVIYGEQARSLLAAERGEVLIAAAL